MLSVRVTLDANRGLIENIHALEDMMGKKISLLSKILLSDTGVLEDKLDVILDTVTSIEVIEQREKGLLISRRTYLVDTKSKKRLVYAKSQIRIGCLPLDIIDQIRKKKAGLGKILTSSQMELRKKIVAFGYDCKKQRLYRSYKIYNKKRLIIDLKEVMLITDKELNNIQIRINGPGGI